MQEFSSEYFGNQAWDKQAGENELIRAALCYIANGLTVVPLPIKRQRGYGKPERLRTPNEMDEYLGDEHDLREHWQENPGDLGYSKRTIERALEIGIEQHILDKPQWGCYQLIREGRSQ